MKAFFVNLWSYKFLNNLKHYYENGVLIGVKIRNGVKRKMENGVKQNIKNERVVKGDGQPVIFFLQHHLEHTLECQKHYILKQSIKYQALKW